MIEQVLNILDTPIPLLFWGHLDTQIVSLTHLHTGSETIGHICHIQCICEISRRIPSCICHKILLRGLLQMLHVCHSAISHCQTGLYFLDSEDGKFGCRNQNHI